MTDVSDFYGIRNCNLGRKEMFSREMFPRSLSVALANYMDDHGIPLNLIHSDTSRNCCVSSIRTHEMYDCTPQEMSVMMFDFDSTFDPWTELAKGVPESGLVLRDERGRPRCCLDLKTSVVPDAATRDLSPESQGPEITLETATVQGIALSMASSLLDERDATLAILRKDIPDDVDWSDWASVSRHIDEIVCNLDILETRFADLQRPRMLQAVWRTETDGPFMTDDAMDVFVWTDFALTRLFLDGNRRFADSRPTRPLRSAVRLFLVIISILEGARPGLASITDMTDYGLGGRKELMVNGKTTNRLMGSDRLASPAVSSLDSTFLISTGAERMFMPERSLEMSMYYAVRTLRR